ncbi:aldo/keto reductase [Arthrobacter mobilis]|uniref:Aldo/keto reductase n=1 Tax=Arthrobacter mobilis TaxID=2724944 RepID=A0A7X6QMB2_9MICC|nr:aldo/keto reductase [Arthrobacter mobilis]NKX56554.1 aldo/keto reductase [Arthrobacter mobilis]
MPAAARAVIGTMNFGGSVDRTTALKIIGMALEAGVTRFDTANIYAGGCSEQLLGELLPRQRDGLEIATKVGLPEPGADTAPLSAGNIRASVERSLHRLRAERIDLLYFHAPDRSTPIAESLAEVGRLHEQGRVAALGLSNFSAWRAAEARHIAAAAGVPVPGTAQQLYNLLARRIEDEFADFVAASAVETTVYNPLAGGLLGGGHHRDRLPEAGRFGDPSTAAAYRDRYWHADVFDAVERLDVLAGDAGLTLPELALRWLLVQDGLVSGVLVGGSRAPHFAANLTALSRDPLPADLAAACSQMTARLRGTMPPFAR